MTSMISKCFTRRRRRHSSRKSSGASMLTSMRPRKAMETPATSTRTTRRFCLILVKPSHYDDDGYVIQWLRSTIPSNSLAAVYGLARDCKQRHIFGEGGEIEIH